AHIRNLPPDAHAFPSITRNQRGSGIAADAVKHRAGIDLANGGQESADNARRGRDIGEIIHLPSEDDVRPGVAFQGLVWRNCYWIELPGIDAISQRIYARARKVAHPASEKFGLL